jgi:hypothetical protein
LKPLLQRSSSKRTISKKTVDVFYKFASLQTQVQSSQHGRDVNDRHFGPRIMANHFGGGYLF